MNDLRYAMQPSVNPWANLINSVEIREVVGQIVRAIVAKSEASNTVKVEAGKLPKEDRAKFIEVVETELLGLHKGNLVRYRIKPSEFTAWKKNWDSKQD